MRFTTLSGLFLPPSTPVIESNTSFDKFSQAMIDTAHVQRARVFRGKNDPVYTNAAVALTRIGANATEYMGSFSAACQSSAFVRPSPAATGADPTTTLPSGSMMLSGARSGRGDE